MGIIKTQVQVRDRLIKLSPLTFDMGNQDTDQILLIGHADNIPLNDVRRPTSPQDMVDILGEDTTSPLYRAFFEAYHSGARDISICAAAPMSEYASPADRDSSFYDDYFDRLETTYQSLIDYDHFDVLVPVEAVFHDFNITTPDFLTQAAEFVDGLVDRGKIVYCLMGVRGNGSLNTLADDTRLSAIGNKGRFVGVITGEGFFDMPELTTSHTAPLAAAAAGRISTLPLDVSVAGRLLDSVRGLAHADPSEEEIINASDAGLIAARTSVRGRRGALGEVYLATSNSLAPAASDYTHLSTLRMIQKVSLRVRNVCSGFVGEAEDRYQLESNVIEELDRALDEGSFRDFDVSFDHSEPGVVDISLTVLPWFEIREISFVVSAGGRT